MSVTSAKNEVVPELELDVVDELVSRPPIPDGQRLTDILDKARSLAGLDLAEAAALLQSGAEQREQIFSAAKDVKERIYGRRVVLFAPLYASNECSNNCLYCAFRRDNKELRRRTLTMPEIAEEVRILEEEGHKRVLLVLGESQHSAVEYAAEAVQTIYETKTWRR